MWRDPDLCALTAEAQCREVVCTGVLQGPRVIVWQIQWSLTVCAYVCTSVYGVIILHVLTYTCTSICMFIHVGSHVWYNHVCAILCVLDIGNCEYAVKCVQE